MVKAAFCEVWADPVTGAGFFDTAADKNVTDRQLAGEVPADVRRLSMKFYVAILTVAQKSPSGGGVLVDRIKNSTDFGCGLQALRIFDEHFHYESDKIRMKSMRKLLTIAI